MEDRNGVTQAQAAELLGLDQPKMSAIMRGKPTGFTIDRLLRLVLALGCDVEIAIRPKGTDQAHLSVAA